MDMSSQPQSSQSGELTSDDLQEVFEALYSITPNYVPFGMKLNVDLNTIKVIERQYSTPYDCFLEILDFRLKQVPPLTWHDIVQALRSPTVQQHDLARTIESQYITASESPASVSQQASAESSHAAIHTSGALPSTHVPPQPPLYTVAAASVPLTHTLPQPSFYNMDQLPHPTFPNQTSMVPNSVAPYPAYNFHLPFYQQQYFQPQVLPPYSVQHRAHFMPSYSGQDSYPYGYPPHMFMYNNQPNQTPPYPAPIPSFPYPPPNQHNLQPVEPNTQSSRGQSANSQTQVPSREPQSLFISTGDNSASVEDGNDCGPPQPKRVCIETPMAQLISYIKTIYERSAIEKQLNVVKWPPTPSKVFINLACIDKKTVVTKQEADEYTKAMVQDGNVDIILKKKTPIGFDDIIRNLPDTAFKKVILVEGAPGVGKSTFAWEFCRRWERGEIAQQYQLVLLLRLRDERMSTAKSLKDLIYHPQNSVREVVTQELDESLGINTLIILEGFDELPDACRRNDSLFSQLIYGTLLPFATILVTSRPWATSDLLTKWEHRISQHIEILGFTESQIEEYVRSVFVGTETQEGGASDSRPGEYADAVMAYIRTYPQIKASMYIPLNSAIVVSMYQESKAGRCILPKTLTELYYGLTQILLVRYLYGHPAYGQRKWRIHSYKDDLPEDVYRSLLVISELAYKGICTEGSMSVQLIFSELPSNIQTLGLMQSVPQLYIIEGPVMSHNFLHLTVQEFLAALHISFMSPTDQREHFQRHDDGRFRVVLRFLAGLTRLDYISLKDLLGKPDKKNYEPQNEYCTYLTPDVAVSTHHVNWMFEAQKSSVVTSTLDSRCIEFVFDKHMLPLEFYSLGYCIAHSQCMWVLVLNEEIGRDEVDMLSSGFLKEKKKGNFTAALMFREIPEICVDLTWNKWSQFLSISELYITVSPTLRSNLSSFCNLKALHLQMIGKSVINIEGISHLKYLQSLTISYIHERGYGFGNPTLSHNSYLCIKELLLSSKCLKCLHLNNKPYRWSIRPKDMELLTKTMTENQSLPLKSLVLGCHCKFTESAAGHLTKFVQHSSSLEKFRFVKFTYTASQLMELIKAIHLNPILQVCELVDPTVGDNVQNITDFLLSIDMAKYPKINVNNFTYDATAHRKNASELLHLLRFNASCGSSWPKLKYENKTYIVGSVAHVDAYVQIWSQFSKETSNTRFLFRDIGDEQVTKIATVLNTRARLQSLYLSNNNISDAGATALAQALHHNSTLERLYLSHNNISDAGATALAQALHHNSTLKELDLSNNNISDVGATALAQVLHHNSTLKELDLSNNNISDVGATALAQVLHHNFTLKRLDLDGNDGIGEEGTRQLIQALTVNTSILSLSLPKRCEEYATQCMEYSAVRDRIICSTSVSSYTLGVSGEQLSLAQLDILTPIAHTCIEFGSQINVDDHILSDIKKEPISWNERLQEVLQYRLKQLPPLTWHDIVRALRSPSVQQYDLARTIESQYITASQSPASVSQQANANSGTKVSPMDQFLSLIKTTYRQSKSFNLLKWPPTPSEVFINLACIDWTTVVTKEEADECTRAMVEDGNVDVILRKKNNIHFDDIVRDLLATDFKKVILVEGAPGVGKSTFAWEFCRRWERGVIAQQYQLVLLLRLRDERMRTAKSLNDLIYHPSRRVCEAVTAELQSTLGVNTLIILEGFDELPDACRSVASVFLELIYGQLLPLATVMVTSRPSAISNIHRECSHRIFQHIEILGFTEHQITTYIESTLSKSTAVGLSEYLEKHPQIRAGMYIPLNCAIVVTMYQESQAGRCALPTTATGLYTALAQTLLLRYLHGHPQYEKDPKHVQSFTDLPPAVYAQFLQLCKLAYSGIASSGDHVQLIFTDLPSDFDNLGFMDSKTEVYATLGAVVSYKFLNITVQEFLTALHTSLMSPEKQMEHFQRHEDDRFKIVLRFLAGVTRLENIQPQAFRNLLDDPTKRDGSIVANVAVNQDHVRWISEAERGDLMSSMFDSDTIVEFIGQNITLLDYYSLGYCIAHSQCQWVLTVSDEIGEEKVRMLVSGASTRQETSATMLGLRGGENEEVKGYLPLSISTEGLNMMFSKLKNLIQLQELALTLPVECSSIAWPDLSGLRVLKLGFSYRRNWTLDTLLPHLSLESLTLGTHYRDGALIQKDCVALVNCITTSEDCLKDLCLQDYDGSLLSDEGVESITKALADNQSLPLRRLDLECRCTLTDTAAHCLAQLITNTTTLQHLIIRVHSVLMDF